MAKPSRSRQPEFDPRELDDLIFTPAVGTGVGSHLVRPEGTEAPAVDTRIPSVTTVVRRKVTTVADSRLWRTESGDIVPDSRVRPVRFAEDVLSAAEAVLYHVLWNAEGAVRGEGDRWRIVQAGYDFLIKTTKLSRKTVQRIVDRLEEKEFIAIERPADMYTRTSTTYRVYSSPMAIETLAAKGRQYTVKIGSGFVFARRLDQDESVQ